MFKRGVNPMTDCIFCKIIAQEIPSTFIQETDDLIVIKDIAPKAPIHYLIIPKKHIKNIQELQPEDFGLMSSMVKMAQQLSSQLLGDGDFRLVINNGFNAGQRVFHLHIHFLAGTTMTD